MASVALALLGIGLVIGIFSKGGLRLDTIGVVASLLAAFSFAFYNIGGHDSSHPLRPLDRASTPR